MIRRKHTLNFSPDRSGNPFLVAEDTEVTKKDCSEERVTLLEQLRTFRAPSASVIYVVNLQKI